MDKGARFHKADFQVHTPRDINWAGGDAVTEAERKKYAEELILACRQKGLKAIAITDHHDFAFFPYVKKAAQDELDDSGDPITTDKKIIVFPGLELTLTAPPCQAILILDADFPDNMLQSVLTALSISPAPAVDSRTATVVRIPEAVVNGLTDLYKILNTHEHIRDRFVIFPNVSEGGTSTILRSGFGDYYKNMPCVGGYIDGSVLNHGDGNRAIVNGKDRNYGFKAIGIFQTSDNRRRDHSNLGTYTTWVKWAEPTAEALRQACLAKESRLSNDEPLLPSLWVTSMSVSNSKFLSRLDIDFNQQYNAIIGGRGTGKSTILEYLRWGLCDQPADNGDSDIAPVQTRRKKLIEDTLQKVDGEVIIKFLLNGVEHIIKRNSKTQEILLKVNGSNFIQSTEQDVRNLLPVQAYSQKQLSSVGVRIEELKRFVEIPIKQKLDQIRSDLRDTETRIRTAYNNLIRKKEISAEITKYDLEISSLTQQLESLRKELTGLSAEDQKIIKQKPKFDNEALIIANLNNELVNAKTLVDSLEDSLQSKNENQNESFEICNFDIVTAIKAKFSEKFGQIQTQLTTLSELFGAESMKEISGGIAKWNAIKLEFDKKYEDAKEKAGANKEQLKRIQEIEKRISELNQLQMDNRNALISLGNPDNIYEELRTKWGNLHNQKIQILNEQCQKFSELSNKLIKAEVKGSLDIDTLKQSIKTAFAGTSIQTLKIDNLCQRVAIDEDPVTTWNELLNELEKLAVHDTTSADPIPQTHLMDECGFIATEKARIVTGMDPLRWLDLSVTEIQFNPIFQYCTNKITNEYIAFADASAGQQATALLAVLLNQQGAPLIIDQPEDDIDTKMSSEIVEQIWKAKKHRQLIFSSHNANFVVNGDAELVICCDYIRSGDQTGGQIKAAGAIDIKAIKDEITLVTEGGVQAFKLRLEKYGF